MDASSKILLVGGVVSLTYGFVLGIPISVIRMRCPQAPRHLITAHLAAIIQGALLIALSIATEFSSLAAPFESVAALLLVGGCVRLWPEPLPTGRWRWMTISRSGRLDGSFWR